MIDNGIITSIKNGLNVDAWLTLLKLNRFVRDMQRTFVYHFEIPGGVILLTSAIPVSLRIEKARIPNQQPQTFVTHSN